MMNIEQVIRDNEFFAADTGRVIESIKIEDLMINIKFKDNNEELSSTISALRAPYRTEAAKKPAYVLAISLGCVIKHAIDEGKYNIKVASMNDDENIDLVYENGITEEEFFQQSLLHDFRTVTFGHVKFVNEMVDMVAQYELELSQEQ